MADEAHIEHLARQKLVFCERRLLRWLVEVFRLLEKLIRSVVLILPLDAHRASGKPRRGTRIDPKRVETEGLTYGHVVVGGYSWDPKYDG